MRNALRAIAFVGMLACMPHTPHILIAPDGTEYVDDCPAGLEDVACFEAVTGA